jgi:5-methylcytosine-specific restriction protein A
MATFLLTWNPKHWEWPEAERRDDIDRTALGQLVPGRWSAGIRKSGVSIGDRIFLLRQNTERGIVGSGRSASEVYYDGHFIDPDKQTTYIDVEWDVVLEVESRLPTEELKRSVPGVKWDYLQGSGVKPDEDSSAALEALWVDHLLGMDFRSPEELPAGALGTEGRKTRIEVNRYERDRTARQKCIEHYGPQCSACGFDFESTYGEIGRNFIHVHHLQELSQLKKTYVVDPIRDLRPLCPNCHTMIHRTHPAMTITSLRSLISLAPVAQS